MELKEVAHGQRHNHDKHRRHYEEDGDGMDVPDDQ
jgi:hypothetical protein